MLPLWLSPAQMRVIPMSDKFQKEAEKLAKVIEANCVRVDIDDRPLTLQKRVREAEMEWVPYIVVLGQREIDSGVLDVRDRRVGEIRKLKLGELLVETEKLTKEMPFKALPLPKRLSERPQFYG